MKKKLALALLIGLSFFVLPQQVSANEIPPSLTYESLDKTTIRLFIQNSNSNREHRICPSILNKQNLDGSWSCHEALKLYSGQGLTYDYKLSYGNTEGFNVNSYDISTKQWSGWSGWHRFTNTNPNEPIVVLPTTTTVPPTTIANTTTTTILTEQENEDYEASCASREWSVNGNCVIVPQWKYVWEQKTYNAQIRTGALCYSGKTSTAKGSGACSHDGGVKNWIYFYKTSTSNVKYKCWLNKNTNTYNKNCIAV